MLREKGLTRYNPFKEFPTKYEEGENILTKVRRILDENEPLTDGAPLIYTPKEDAKTETPETSAQMESTEDEKDSEKDKEKMSDGEETTSVEEVHLYEA